MSTKFPILTSKQRYRKTQLNLRDAIAKKRPFVIVENAWMISLVITKNYV